MPSWKSKQPVCSSKGGETESSLSFINSWNYLFGVQTYRRNNSEGKEMSCHYFQGYRMVSFDLKVLAIFCLCSNSSRKLDGCSLARARKIFATACQMLALAKINTLLACSQMLAKTILYPYFRPSFGADRLAVLFFRTTAKPEYTISFCIWCHKISRIPSLVQSTWQMIAMDNYRAANLE